MQERWRERERERGGGKRPLTGNEKKKIQIEAKQ